MQAAEILTKASELVGGARDQEHGDKFTNFNCIAAVWNGYLLARTVSNKPFALSAVDVGNMMELLKVARRLSGAHNADDYVDAAGYAGCAGEIAGGKGDGW